VSFWSHGAEGRPAKDPLAVIASKQVGEVGVTSGKLLHGNFALDAWQQVPEICGESFNRHVFAVPHRRRL
jgi:hypothetical protein